MSPWPVIDELAAAVPYFAIVGVSVTGLPLLAVSSLVLVAVRGMTPSRRRQQLTWAVGSIVAVLGAACVAPAVAR